MQNWAVVVVGEKGVGSEGQRWEEKECQIPKTRGHRLEGFLDSTTKVHRSHHLSKIIDVLEVVAVVGKSTRAAVLFGDAQESVDRATVAKHMPFLVGRSGYSDFPSVLSSQSSDRVLAGPDTGAENDEESLVGGWDNAAEGRVVVGGRSQIQSLRRGTQRPWFPISEQ